MVTITDANLCTLIENFTITQPTALALSETHINATCGNSNGSIDLTVMGGTGSYTYLWTGGAITEDLSNLVAGFYTVTVTDANACTKTLTVEVTESSALVLTETHVEATCGDFNGSIDLTVMGGTGPYTYAWTNGEITQDLMDLTSGIYTVTVTDANACTDALMVTILYLPVSNISDIPVTHYATIQAAINAVTTTNGETIEVCSGTYNEQVLVNKSLTILGTSPKPMIDFTGTVTGKPTLFDISANAVVIDNLQFKVDLTKLSSAIIASTATLEDITIQNNEINPYQSTAGVYLSGYSNRNAISINYGGSINYTANPGGVDNIVVDNNLVTATVSSSYLGDGAGDIGFRSAVSVDYGSGTYTRNTFQSINHDILVRYNNPSTPTLIGGSVPNKNYFNGGGVQVSPNNEAGNTVTISHNQFDGSVVGSATIPGSVLRLQNNQQHHITTVSNNTFNNLRWGMSVENYPDVTVSDNTFNPLAGYTDFRHITVNTKCLSSDSPTIPQVEINGVFKGNTFNSLTPTVGGTALSFYNHDSEDEVLGTFTLGGAGALANTFKKDFTNFIYLSDQVAVSSLDYPGFPEYSTANLGAGSGTPMACWNKDINIEQNTFNVGVPGTQNLPVDMNHAQRVTLEGKLYHEPDSACLGQLIYFKPLLVTAKVFLQGPYIDSTNTMKDALRQISMGPVFPLSTPYDTMSAFVKTNNFVTETITTGVRDNNDPNNAIVDWVWLELRQDTNTLVATRSALVQRDGDIVDMDGTSEVSFPDTYEGEYYLMVRHRNHLGVMSAVKVNYVGGSPLFDFTSDAPQYDTYGTTGKSARKLLETGVYGLWAGNTNKKAGALWLIKYNGSQNDRVLILNRVGISTPLDVVPGYYHEDVNLNGETKYNGSGNDRIIILNNLGLSNPLGTINQQPQK
jgi:hypothetical protein